MFLTKFELEKCLFNCVILNLVLRVVLSMVTFNNICI